MKRRLVVAIPGPWQDRTDFITRVVTTTGGEFMFAGGILAHPRGNDHVELGQEERLLKFSRLLRKIDGHAVKIDH